MNVNKRCRHRLDRRQPLVALGALGGHRNFLVALRELGGSDEGFGELLWLGSPRVNLWLSPQMKDSDCARRIGQARVQKRRSGEIDRLMARHVHAEQ